jgi:diaminohydroxyphosphoribosylaminopyrimidine deaminase/5-amino-6-(5-phosphoribosylamino)uracil reductase
MSMDGKICCNSGDSKWITSDPARTYARTLRGEYDAILVGITTVLQDDPGLRAEQGKDPVRVILDSRLRTPVHAAVLSDSNVIIATTERCDKKKKELLEKKDRIWVCGTEKVDLRRLQKKLGDSGITSLFIEGGSEVNASAVKERIVDNFLIFAAPKLITGSHAKGPIGGCGIETMDEAVGLKDLKITRVGEDILIEAYPDW